MNDDVSVYPSLPSPQSDHRLIQAITEILTQLNVKTVANIGAGTEYYSLDLVRSGFKVLAIAPFSSLYSRGTKSLSLKWRVAHPENLPLENGCVDACLMIFPQDSLRNAQQAFKELARISRKKVVIVVTRDPEMVNAGWINRYFPCLPRTLKAKYFPIPVLMSELETVTGSCVKAQAFELPKDFRGCCASMGWHQPERYLEAAYTARIPELNQMDVQTRDLGLKRLKVDLENGTWESLFGKLRSRPSFDAGHRIIYSWPASVSRKAHVER